MTVQDIQGNRHRYDRARDFAPNPDNGWLAITDEDGLPIAMYPPGQWTCVEPEFDRSGVTND